MERELVAIIHLNPLNLEVVWKDFKFKCVENCAKCCRELDIPLREGDIERIKALGYEEDYFVDFTKMFYRGSRFLGYSLKKRPFDGTCVFLDENGKCKIYEHRPIACKLYPFILVKHGNFLEVYVKKDPLCPGINHPEGRPIDWSFVREYFGEVLQAYEVGMPEGIEVDRRVR
ncbi:YkgJ family cysteine cluster protein [Pyrococcus yayanosii]|nr:YkgJ family cysteine cluster protein [Pyrococcus yayanosii]